MKNSSVAVTFFTTLTTLAAWLWKISDVLSSWCVRCLNDLKLFLKFGCFSNMCRNVRTPIDSISLVRVVQLVRITERGSTGT